MTTQHTPGPWEVTPFLTPNEDDDPVGIYKVEPAFSQLSELYWSLDPEPDEPNYAPDFHERVHGVNASNAQLIAAAPDMLRSLQFILQRLEQGGSAAKSDCLSQCSWAIAKATGGPVMAA